LVSSAIFFIVCQVLFFSPFYAGSTAAFSTAAPSPLKMMSGGPVLGVKGLARWAVVGDVTNTAKPAFRVANKLESSGRTVYRVSPYVKDPSQQEDVVYKKLSDIPPETKIDAVNLIISPTIGVSVLEEMANRNIRYAFIQPGADGGNVLAKAKELGIIVEQGCVLVQPLPSLL
jgi:predicted CoA-binding protein